jgi:lipopolysaccharide transport system permease protein
MQTFSLKPIDMFSAFSRHRALTIASIRRDVVGRYRGSVLGILWSFFNPLLLLSVYTVVFGLVYQSRWGEASGSIFDFAMLLFAGLIVFNFFQECLNRAPTVVLLSPILLTR